MSQRRSLFIGLVFRFEDGYEPVLLPITSPLHIVQLLSLRCLGGCVRILNMLRPRVIPETMIERLDSFKTLPEPNSHCATADDED